MGVSIYSMDSEQASNDLKKKENVKLLVYRALRVCVPVIIHTF
jgi:hypothetical protein